MAHNNADCVESLSNASPSLQLPVSVSEDVRGLPCPFTSSFAAESPPSRHHLPTLHPVQHHIYDIARERVSLITPMHCFHSSLSLRWL